MINITPYIDKLEVLKEYMFHKIDDKRVQFKINTGALPSWRNPDDIIKMFFETGYLFYTSDTEKEPTLTLVSFEEFYQMRINQK